MRLRIDEIPVGMNGSKGLLRMGHRARSNYNEFWRQLVRSAIDNSHKPCRVKQAVFISQMRQRLFDPDNLAASCKPILDALVHWKLIKDDSEKWCDFHPVQIVGKQKITIIQIQPCP